MKGLIKRWLHPDSREHLFVILIATSESEKESVA